MKWNNFKITLELYEMLVYNDYILTYENNYDSMYASSISPDYSNIDFEKK